VWDQVLFREHLENRRRDNSRETKSKERGSDGGLFAINEGFFLKKSSW